LSYKRTNESQRGSISLTITQVNVTTTETVALASPIDPRLKAELTGGNKPATTPSNEEADAANDAGESVLHAALY
jgi:hypothetical protein